MTQLQFYAYRLHVHHSWELLFCSRALFQEFGVDVWAQVEQGCLDWFSRNQKTIRQEIYQGVRDSLGVDYGSDGQVPLHDIGKRVILSSSLMRCMTVGLWPSGIFSFYCFVHLLLIL